MNVQNAVGKLLHKPGGQQTHVSGEHDELSLVFLEGSDDQLIVLFTCLSLRRYDERFQASAACRLDAWRVCFVGDYDSDVGVEFAGGDIVGDGFKVRAAPGKEDAEVFHWH